MTLKTPKRASLRAFASLGLPFILPCIMPFKVQAASFSLATAKNLKLELEQALSKQEPLIIMVSLDGCPFCKIARDHYLRSVQLEQKLRIVQVDMGSRSVVLDPQGRSSTHAQLIQSWGVKLAPTLLFLGKDGKELVERLEGGSSSDFYGAYLDDRIARALRLSKT